MKLTMRGLFSVSIAALFLLVMAGCSSLPGDDASALDVKDEEGLISVFVLPFEGQVKIDQSDEIAAVINADLQRSGRFRVLSQDQVLARPASFDDVDYKVWKALGVEYLVIGSMQSQGTNGYEVQFRLLNTHRERQIIGFRIKTKSSNLRVAAHRISDQIYKKILGVPGAFATRLAYIHLKEQVDDKPVNELIIADADGHNPYTIVRSTEPLMSPAWSPDGRKIAYVSFEKGHTAIFVQEVYTGKRKKIAGFKGINSAPAWSPNGDKLALTLSKEGNPDIYVYDMTTQKLQAVTLHYAVDTEPAWSPDGRSIVFTSDRGGEAQIYRVAASGGEARRITFNNSYNASACFSPDGKLLALVTREEENDRIAVMDLESGEMQVLSNGSLDESPSFAPNGSMVIYTSKTGRHAVLAAVSVDGRVRHRFSPQQGEVREPAWSPFIN